MQAVRIVDCLAEERYSLIEAASDVDHRARGEDDARTMLVWIGPFRPADDGYDVFRGNYLLLASIVWEVHEQHEVILTMADAPAPKTATRRKKDEDTSVDSPKASDVDYSWLLSDPMFPTAGEQDNKSLKEIYTTFG